MRIATLVAAVILIATMAYSADLLLHDHGAPNLLSPPMIALLMVGNLIPAIVLLVLLSRLIARRRGARQGVGEGQLHMRLVALFSVVAAVPTVAVAIFASLLVQSSLEFWFSDSAREIVDNSIDIANASLINEGDDVAGEAIYMAGDMDNQLPELDPRGEEFNELLREQTYTRELSEAAILRIDGSEIEVLSAVQPYEGMLNKEEIIAAAARLSTSDSVQLDSINRIAMLSSLPRVDNGYLYVARRAEGELLERLARAERVKVNYEQTLDRSRDQQLQFFLILFLGAVVIVALAIFAALKLADRIGRPVGQLVDAAGRVEKGDFTTRVPPQPAEDEIATLAAAFNRMTSRIEEQTGALLDANELSELRRAFIEAVLGSVTAGVIAVDDDERIQLINRSAAMLLGDTEENLAGTRLGDTTDELGDVLAGTASEASVELRTEGGARTLAVKRVRYEDGTVLTFDDVTDQLADQRRAAWSDIARRIAHEIKNPLTPIQLAAERLQRRYGDKIPEDDDTFGRLTDTIVRQVGDLRRMVDEFSNFARMPKPIFRDENIHDIARAALFLHEVAHPGIHFEMRPAHADIRMVGDRRQLAQALTNIVKNAVEAIEARRKTGVSHEEGDRIILTIEEGDGQVAIDLEDNGVGLPEERERLTEPYMTTRVRGTGLGLAIVKKIVEEHEGQIAFLDRAGGGTHVRILFDAAKLAERAEAEPAPRLVRVGDDNEYDEDEN
ncbi:ATP-binding protein [Sphingomicrobium sp. XHP0235]|uniref:sensor histidine kinase NtrY-like n=1 Tax=Sphingomicrobium aquimarinum TaxID=3133971 RepID=UPI0031FED713